MNHSSYFQLLIEEYKTLREESKQAGINMWTAMQWGTAILAILFGVGFTQWTTTSPISFIIFSLVVPVFSFMTMSFWLGEAARLKRAGDYLCLLESKAGYLLANLGQMPVSLEAGWTRIQIREEYWLNLRTELRHVDTDVNLWLPLAWEKWLRVKRNDGPTSGHLTFLFALRLGFFPMVSVGSLVIAILWVLDRTQDVRSVRILVFGWIMGVVIAVATLLLGYVLGNNLRVPVRSHTNLEAQVLATPFSSDLIIYGGNTDSQNGGGSP